MTNTSAPSIPDRPAPAARRVLEPIERVSEVLFGLIMVLTFTGSLSVAEAGREDVRAMLIGAIGCNIAWGLVDAIMYLMNTMTERARGGIALRTVRSEADARQAHRVIAESLPEAVSSVMTETELESIRQRLRALPEPGRTRALSRDDWRGAVAVFLLVFLSTLPVVLPFAFMSDARLALRISNGIAIVMLFVGGVTLGRYTGRRPWLMGVAMVIVGLVLAAMTLALGG